MPAESAESETVSRLIRDIIDVLGPVQDRSGKPGVNREKLDAFMAELKAFSEWWKKAEQDQSVLTFGLETEEAARAFLAVSAKVEDYFTRCRLAAFDGKAAEPLNASKDDYARLTATLLSESSPAAEQFPLSLVEPGKPLSLETGINPAWSGRIELFGSLVALPVLGNRGELTFEDWQRIKKRFVPYEAWTASRPAGSVDKLGRERVREILGSGDCDKLGALIDADKAREAEANNLGALDRLVHYHRYLHRLLNNFVSLRDFYTRRANGIFQFGTLFIDGRSCTLCLRVDNVAKHALIATMSRTFLLYCDCLRRGSNEKMTIVAAVTAGDSSNLMVGRNGLFYDASGRDWDATIVHIIDNPISISQAALSPYRRAARMISEQVQKIAAARDKSVHEGTTTGVEGSVREAEKSKVQQPPFDVGKFAGIFAAIGLAIGAIGTAIAAILGGFLSLSWWKMPIALLGVALAISGPSMIMAWFKLRGRTLAPILDANDWAVNTKAKINLMFGQALTSTAQLPEGTERSLQDPFHDKQFPWRIVGLVFILLAIAAWSVYQYFYAR